MSDRSSCWPWVGSGRTRAPASAGEARALPPYDLLADVFFAFPDRLEIRAASGVVYCNRSEPRPANLTQSTTTALPNGATLTTWKEDALHVSLHDLPALSWIAEPRNGGGPWTFRVNSRWADFCGVPPDQWQSAVHPDDSAAAFGEWERAIATGTRFEVDNRVRRADGQYLWFRNCAEPVRNARGVVVGFVGVQ
jgi:PAS domain-containing protein